MPKQYELIASCPNWKNVPLEEIHKKYMKDFKISKQQAKTMMITMISWTCDNYENLMSLAKNFNKLKT